MTMRKVMLGPDAARELVQIATRCDFDIDISYNRYTVDAKSILGVLALDFSQIMTISYNGISEDLEQFLSRFAMAC
ncbi:MAG: HPr family phosphocarrier protein [Lachnospiraceae bacterium]|nr:HPr family phosphocarrier protein [Lachnospiraceae bacterium]